MDLLPEGISAATVRILLAIQLSSKDRSLSSLLYLLSASHFLPRLSAFALATETTYQEQKRASSRKQLKRADLYPYDLGLASDCGSMESYTPGL